MIREGTIAVVSVRAIPLGKEITMQIYNHPPMVKASAEYTDTFGGEANYAWCHRCRVEEKSKLAVVRRVKREFSLTGVRCRREDVGDEIWLYPQGMCTVVFISFNE